MSHPLIGDLTALTNDELQTKLSDLTKKYNQASRMGMTDVIRQMQLILDDYHYEMRRRQEKAMEEMMSKSAEFKHIIDIQ